MEKVADLLWGEESFDRVATEVSQRRVVKVGLDKRALCEKNLLNRAQKAYLFGIVVVGLDVLLEAALHHLRVIGDGIEGKQVAEESEKVVHAQAVGDPDISAGQLDVVAAEFAVERSLQINKLIVCDLPALAERGERGVLFHNFEDAGIHAPFVFFNEDLVPAFADRDVAVGRDEVRQVDLQEGARAVATVLHLRREVTDDLRELCWRSGREVSGESECSAGRRADALGDVGQQAHVFRNRLEQLRRRRRSGGFEVSAAPPCG